MPPKALSTYLARMCWNDQLWIGPAGVANQAETRSYAKKLNYGHEEWLFNSSRIYNGWQYGFLEPVSRSHKRLLADNETEIHTILWTKDPCKNRWHIGEINNCVVLTDDMMSEAAKYFIKTGHLQQMTEQLLHMGLQPHGFSAKDVEHSFVNIRFRPSDLNIYDPPRPIPPNHPHRKLARYNLVRMENVEPSPQRGRRGSNTPKPDFPSTRQGTAATIISYEHNRLQNILHSALKRMANSKHIQMEEDWIDLQLQTKDALHLFEIKADPRPAACIREALGQLLEYAHRKSKVIKTGVVLHICGPGVADAAVIQYMTHLRKTVHYPMYYHQIEDGLKKLDLAKDT